MNEIRNFKSQYNYINWSIFQKKCLNILNWFPINNNKLYTKNSKKQFDQNKQYFLQIYQ